MADFLFIHGAWHGGWCWANVQATLDAAGHRTLAFCMPGVGSRVTELTPDIGLEQHVAAAREAAMRLNRPIVVAHSYGGLIARLLDDRFPDDHDAIVYLEALIPQDNQSAVDLMPPDRHAFFHAAAQARGGGWRLPPPTDMGRLGVFDTQVAAQLAAQLTDHPWRTFIEPVRLRASHHSTARHFYLFATDRESQPLLPFVERYRKDKDWTVLGLPGGHETMITNPQGLCELLLGIAASPAMLGRLEEVSAQS
jgi:pimeloyl-ACP methyl ester carboxylesterase